eukprot:jgi/Psemu1/9412/gm1.9412_g
MVMKLKFKAGNLCWVQVDVDPNPYPVQIVRSSVCHLIHVKLQPSKSKPSLWYTLTNLITWGWWSLPLKSKSTQMHHRLLQLKWNQCLKWDLWLWGNLGLLSLSSLSFQDSLSMFPSD